MATLFTQEKTAYNISGTSVNFTFKLEIIENSVNVEDSNTSNVTINFYAKNNNTYGGYESYSQPRATISLDGTQLVSTAVTKIYQQTSYFIIATWTGDIEHNEDGTKAINVTATYIPNSTTSYLPQTTSITASDLSLTDIEVQAKIYFKNNNTWVTSKGYIKVDEWKKIKKVYIKLNDVWLKNK